jgi:hypothetical protein
VLRLRDPKAKSGIEVTGLFVLDIRANAQSRVTGLFGPVASSCDESASHTAPALVGIYDEPSDFSERFGLEGTMRVNVQPPDRALAEKSHEEPLLRPVANVFESSANLIDRTRITELQIELADAGQIPGLHRAHLGLLGPSARPCAFARWFTARRPARAVSAIGGQRRRRLRRFFRPHHSGHPWR